MLGDRLLMVNRITVLGVVSQNAAREARLVSDFVAIVLICMYPFLFPQFY